MTGRVIRVELPVVTKRLNETLRMHYRVRSAYQRSLSWELRVALGNQRPASPFARAKVRIERHSIGTADHDGFVGGLKELIDCLLPQGEARMVNGKPRLKHPTGLGLVADDNPAVLQLDAVQVKAASRKEQKTVIIITELPNEA